MGMITPSTRQLRKVEPHATTAILGREMPKHCSCSIQPFSWFLGQVWSLGRRMLKEDRFSILRVQPEQCSILLFRRHSYVRHTLHIPPQLNSAQNLFPPLKTCKYKQGQGKGRGAYEQKLEVTALTETACRLFYIYAVSTEYDSSKMWLKVLEPGKKLPVHPNFTAKIFFLDYWRSYKPAP